jgi:hypothetical protein
MKLLRQMRREPLGGLFPAFVLTEPFKRYVRAPAVGRARRYRDEIVHRERPRYREAPGFARTSLWSQPSFTITYPIPNPGQGLPSLQERRELVAAAIDAAFDYAVEAWRVADRLLASLGVRVVSRNGQVSVSTTHGQGFTPREQRDPGPFVASPS